MEANEYILKKFGINPKQESPIKLEIDKPHGLTGIFRELGYREGAEIGVRVALFSKWLLYKVPKLKLYLVDPWIAYEGYSEWRDQKNMDDCYNKAVTRVGKLNTVFIRKYSMEAAKEFKDESLDFVYIDANHAFEYVVEDIAAWSKKVRKGGIVSGHDYSDYMFQVTEAIHGWAKAKRIKPWFVTNNKNWFYVKK